MVIFGNAGAPAMPPRPGATMGPNQQFYPYEPPTTPPHQGWSSAPQAPSTSYGPPQYQLPGPPALPQRPLKSSHSISRLNLASVTDLFATSPQLIKPTQISNEVTTRQEQGEQQYLINGDTLYDLLSSKFDALVTLIDGGGFSGDESDLAVFQPYLSSWNPQEMRHSTRSFAREGWKETTSHLRSSGFTGTNYFAKADMYANSKLTRDLPPMKLYLPTFPLLCLAAQYSDHVYTKPTGKEREAHVSADWRTGTKAMVIKSVPMDDMNTIVFAIRGTQTFMDWTVNLNYMPTSPEGFLDDPDNFCHGGFLSVARKMVKPVAARLRNLLEESPDRSGYSLLITGHSAGGAVAALLYAHMLATSPGAESELNILMGCFKRVHCVTFGVPPISLFPLAKPSDPALRKSVFLSFVNEGDPVTRADKAYVRSLLELYSSPAPGQSCLGLTTPRGLEGLEPLTYQLRAKTNSSLTINKIRPSLRKSRTAPTPSGAPIWKVPDTVLSNAGRVVLLRGVEASASRPHWRKRMRDRMDEGVVAQMVSDELLRGVIWGDPVCHMMKLYARRIEVLATNAVLGREG